MKLEIKHLAGYLPYGLKILGNGNIHEIIGFKDETYFIKGGNVYAYGDIQDCKPILRPLSDLTKEIEVNGEKFVPENLIDGTDLRWLLVNDIDEIKLYTYNLLLYWHFDIYGLIEAGLAIDINTLKK